MAKTLKTKGIDIPVQFETAPKEKIDLAAYAFTREGEMLAKSNISNNKAHFDMSMDQVKNLRFLISPDISKYEGGRMTSVAELKSMGAYEPVLKFNGGNKATTLPVPDHLSKLWFWQKCRVTGTVTKAFEIDGILQDMPVCQVRVHICEVNKAPLVIPRLPDWVMERLRDVLLQPEPIPFPGPGPEFRQPRMPEVPPVPPRFMTTGHNRMEQHTGIERQQFGGETWMAQRSTWSQNIRASLISSNVNQLKHTLINNFQLFHPIFCMYPWTWSYLYTCTEKKVVTTDGNGRFDTCVYYPVSGDQPDLYFWVEAFVGGTWTTVYRPNIPCNTYWDCASGLEVNIRLTDERVPYMCSDTITGQVAWIKRVGQNVDVTRIMQNFTTTSIQGRTWNQVGLTNAGRSDGKYVRPFAKNLSFWVQFGSGFPTSGVTHYRWRYRKLRTDKLINDMGEWKTISNPMWKPYTVEVTDSDGDTTIITKHWPMGPEGTADNPYFKIPPASPKGAAVAGDPTAEWDQNTNCATLDTQTLDNGLYEFRMELLNSSGVPQDVPENTFLVSSSPNSMESTNVGDDPAKVQPYLEPMTGRSNRVVAFTMKMRIDNLTTHAEVENVTLGGAADTTGCGFLDYTNGNAANVKLSFAATQPNHFATYAFQMAKGNMTSEAPITNQANLPMVIENSDGFNLGGDGLFSKMTSPNELLGSCTRAAFAEILRVYALHTNGTTRISEYDSRDDDAFALSPTTTT